MQDSTKPLPEPVLSHHQEGPMAFLWWHYHNEIWRLHPGPWFNIKMLSYQYRKSHCGDNTILWPSYLHNGISYTGKKTSLYWIGALISQGPVSYRYAFLKSHPDLPGTNNIIRHSKWLVRRMSVQKCVVHQVTNLLVLSVTLLKIFKGTNVFFSSHTQEG